MLEHQQCILAVIITVYCCRHPKPLLLDLIIRKLKCIVESFLTLVARSYVTSKIGWQLNLPTVGEETLLIKTFSDTQHL